MKRKNIILLSLTAILFSICFASCSKDDEFLDSEYIDSRNETMGIGLSAGKKPPVKESRSLGINVIKKDINK